MPTYDVDWRAPNICLSVQPVFQSGKGAEGEEEGCSMIASLSFWVVWGGGRRECSLVTRQSSVIQMTRLPLSQAVAESLSFSLSPSLCIFSNSHFYLLYLFPLCLCFPFPFLSSLTTSSIFLASLTETPPCQVLFWLYSCGGFSLLQLYSTAGLCTHFLCRALQPTKTWNSLNCSALGKTRLSQGEAWCGEGEAEESVLNMEYAWFKQKTWQTWPRKSRIRLPNICSELPKGQQSRGANTQHTPFIAFQQETSPNPLKGTLGAMSSHEGKQQVTNWITCLEVRWMHWCDYFRNFSLKEEFKHRKKWFEE